MRAGPDRWLVLAALLLVAPSIYWANEAPGQVVQMPVSPFDRTNVGAAEQWVVVAAARDHVPPGATLMTIAPDPGTEMSMFMFAVGLFPENKVIPRSYWGAPVDSGEPDYVISFGCDPSMVKGMRKIADVPFGCICRMGE